MYNPNEMDNTLNEEHNNTQEMHPETDAASVEQANFENTEGSSKEPYEATENGSAETTNTVPEEQASNEAHAEQTQAPSYTSAYTNPTNSYSHYQANPYGQQPYNAYRIPPIAGESILLSLRWVFRQRQWTKRLQRAPKPGNVAGRLLPQLSEPIRTGSPEAAKAEKRKEADVQRQKDSPEGCSRRDGVLDGFRRLHRRLCRPD